jgi:hypothetical protein
LRRDGEASTVNGFKDFVSAAGEERGAGLVAEFFGISAVAGVAK